MPAASRTISTIPAVRQHAMNSNPALVRRPHAKDSQMRMTSRQQDFASIARYFEARARKTTTECRRVQFLLTAQLYHAKALRAEQPPLAPCTNGEAGQSALAQPVLTRRERLIALFRDGNGRADAESPPATRSSFPK
jgi:hypothetical protein